MTPRSAAGVNGFAVIEHVLRSGDGRLDLDWAVAAGVTGFGLYAPWFDRFDATTIKSMLDVRGLQLSSVYGVPELSLEHPVQETAQIERAIQRWATAGARTLVPRVGPLANRSFAEADSHVDAALRRISPIAERHDVKVLIEPIHPIATETTFIHTLRHAASLVADYPGCGVLLDVAHLFWDRQFYDDLAESAELVCTVQIADVDPQASGEYCYRRCQLGDGCVPLVEMVSALQAAGYRGFYEFESIQNMPKGERTDFVIAARRWFSSVLQLEA
jgi:sugar phosphate isomerase/epimerase